MRVAHPNTNKTDPKTTAQLLLLKGHQAQNNPCFLKKSTPYTKRPGERLVEKGQGVSPLDP
jgi:hypothetical protein